MCAPGRHLASRPAARPQLPRDVLSKCLHSTCTVLTVIHALTVLFLALFFLSAALSSGPSL